MKQHLKKEEEKSKQKKLRVYLELHNVTLCICKMYTWKYFKYLINVVVNHSVIISINVLFAIYSHLKSKNAVVSPYR